MLKKSLKDQYKNIAVTPENLYLVEYCPGSHRLEKYLNIQDCLEKSLKFKYALKTEKYWKNTQRP